MRHDNSARSSHGATTTRESTVGRKNAAQATETDRPMRSYGVVRVYSRQYEYVLSDAETTQANIRALLKAVKTSELDPNAGKAR